MFKILSAVAIKPQNFQAGDECGYGGISRNIIAFKPLCASFSVLFSLTLLSTSIGLYGMGEEMPAEEQPVEATVAEPAPEAATLAPEGAAAPIQAATSPQPSEAQPAAPYVEAKAEQLGEFEMKEDLQEITKNVDPKIVTLIRKADDLNKQISEATINIQNIRDDLFNKFSDINNTLDTVYQKIGFEYGKIKESLKEGK